MSRHISGAEEPLWRRSGSGALKRFWMAPAPESGAVFFYQRFPL